MTQRNIREKENPLLRAGGCCGEDDSPNALCLWLATTSFLVSPAHTSLFLGKLPSLSGLSGVCSQGGHAAGALGLSWWPWVQEHSLLPPPPFPLVLAELSSELRFRQYSMPGLRGSPRTPASCLSGTHSDSAYSLGLFEVLGLEGDGRAFQGLEVRSSLCLGPGALCSFGDGTPPAGVTRTQGRGLLSSLRPNSSGFFWEPAPQRVGTEAQGKVWGTWAGPWGREEGPGVWRVERPLGMSSASPMAAETH